MNQGNCTLCKHSHLQEQMGSVQRICRKGPPSVVVMPQPGQRVALLSVWPVVGERIVCDAFEPETTQ